MIERKFQVSLRHKTTGEKLNLEVWAESNEAATHKLIGSLIGYRCEYEWTGTDPLYENNHLIEREED